MYIIIVAKDTGNMKDLFSSHMVRSHIQFKNCKGKGPNTAEKNTNAIPKSLLKSISKWHCVK